MSAGSMMADVAEQHELRSGRSQSGIFFSSTSFSGKLASGFGHFVAGVGLDAIAFPLQADPSEVGVDAIRHLGLLNLAAAGLTGVAIWIFRWYAIDRREPARTRDLLAQKHRHGHTVTEDVTRGEEVMGEVSG